MAVERLTGEVFRKLVLAGAAALEREKAAVDALNVFPVPDGDTGTNMSLTMQAAVREVEKCRPDTVAEVGRAVSLGSLMGARGNSGVILSQLFRGLARGMEGRVDLPPAELARSLQAGVDTAYKAVMRPVEGTILTVAREMARYAARSAREGGSIGDLLESARTGAELALERTPDLLPVLKQAGVVDAGGKGLLCILAGMSECLNNVLPAEVAETQAARETPGTFGRAEGLPEIVFAYDTQLLIRGADLRLDDVRAQIARFGDSLLVVGTEELAKVHVHTNSPGLVLEACLRYGTLTEITVENMREQFEALRRTGSFPAGRTHAESGGLAAAGQSGVAGAAQDELPGLRLELAQPSVQPAKELGVVAVAVGEGLERILRSLGADVIINGGQTMNPSTEELVAGMEAVTTEQVLLLPNNKNILMAAEQALKLTKKRVAVVPTANIPQGISALLAYNPQADLDANRARMEAAMRETHTGEITYAVRGARYEDREIKAGDVLAISEDRILAVGEDPADVLEQLVRCMVDDGSEFLTIFYGAEVRAADAEATAQLIRDHYPQLEVELHHGGQPLFFYLVSLE